MNIGEVKDVVREHFGRLGFPTTMLDLALGQGRRELEKAGNWWWMRRTKSFNSVADQQSYSIVLSTSNGLNLPNFKDIRALTVKPTSDTRWEPVSVGEITQEELEMLYRTDEDGMTDAAVVDSNTTDGSQLILFPIPDVAYNHKMWHYEWTFNPTANTGEDEVTKWFPEALIYGSLVWAYEQYIKDLQSASYWRALLGLDQAGRIVGGEIQKIKRHNLKREKQEKAMLEPHSGPYDRRRFRRLDRLYI